MLDVRHLRYFQAVAEELSFSRAARRLRVAQPALSRAIKELEDHLGVMLLSRTRRGASLTPAGAALLHDSALLLQRFDEVFRRAQRIAAGEEGELRLGYIGPPTRHFMGAILREFRKRYPRVSIVLEERTPERVWEMVARGRLAIGLTRPVLAEKALGLETLLLRREPLWAVLPSGHPLLANKRLRWKDLIGQPLVILARREGGGLYDTIMEACAQAGFSPHLVHTPSLMSTVLSYVEAGAGIGIMSDTVTALAANQPLKFMPLEPHRTVDLVMVWSKNEESPPARAFRDLIYQWLKSKMLWKGFPEGH